MYATAELRSWSACASVHSVEPIKPHSSASHAANQMLRGGGQPAALSFASARAASSIATVPERLSTAPTVQES